MLFLILIVSLAIGFGYYFNQYYFSYWSKRGFKQVDPTFLFGNALPVMMLKKTMGEYFQDLYTQYKKHKMLGIYLFYRPVMIVTDPKLVHDIMIRDFSSFHDRPLACHPENDPLSGNLFNLPGKQWRDMRVKLSPTFTSGKLKGMFSTIKDCTKVLEDYLVKNVEEGTDVFEFRDLMARFNTNIISSVAFGVENDCINEPDNIFRKTAATLFEPNVTNAVRNTIGFFGPKLFHKLKLRMVNRTAEDFFFSIVKQNVEYREQNNLSRNDFMQLLIQLKNKGYVSADKGDKESEDVQTGNIHKLNMNQVTAQAFLFYTAGFETSSSTLSFCLFEIARRPELQRKVQEEADRVFKNAGPEGITYEMLSELKYAESCIDETLRKYPIVPLHFREASRDYKVTDSDLVIPQGTSIFIPVLGFHRDPEIYDDPMEFKPERFLNSSHGGGKVKGLFYTPFGDGPRNCIGMRMGKLTTKIGLALMLSKFNLELTDKDMLDKELEFHPNQFMLTPRKLFKIKITKR